MPSTVAASAPTTTSSTAAAAAVPKPTTTPAPPTPKPTTTTTTTTTKPKPPPTPSPTKRPTAPLVRPPGYFNYDKSDSKYGPDAWHLLDTSGNQWDGETGIPSDNFCPGPNDAAGGGGTKNNAIFQSPVLLSPPNGGYGRCYASRQLRPKAGRFDVCNPNTGVFAVTPTRARLVFGTQNQPPSVNDPRFGNAIDAKYLEVAIPSLHRVEDSSGQRRRYDGEYTIVHPHKNSGKIVMISVLIDGSGNVDNRAFQVLLEGWEDVTICFPNFLGSDAGGRRGLRSAVGSGGGDTASSSREQERLLGEQEQEGKGGKQKQPPRLLQNADDWDTVCDFDVYHRDLLPDAYYRTYEGSLPEPPCTPGALWHVMNKPMKISRSQLSKLKSILTGSDGPCHGDPLRDGLGEHLVRPVQSLRGREIMECSREDYSLDCEPRRCECATGLCTEDFE